MGAFGFLLERLLRGLPAEALTSRDFVPLRARLESLPEGVLGEEAQERLETRLDWGFEATGALIRAAFQVNFRSVAGDSIGHGCAVFGSERSQGPLGAFGNQADGAGF